MIDNYEIKQINNKDILYLYLNINFEFGKLKNTKKKDLKRTIIKFIKDNKIKFRNGLVAIVISGSIIKTVAINKNDFKDNNLSNILVSNAITENSSQKINNIILENDLNKNDILEIKEPKEENINNLIDTKANNSIIEIKDSNNEKIVNNIDENKNIQKNITNNYDSINNTLTNNENYINNNGNFDIEIDNNTYITIKKNDGITQKIELEEYVIGVLGAEMPAEFNNEALKAGAIIARTYALKQNDKENVLNVNESNQSYRTNEELRNVWGNKYDTYYNKIRNAVINTKGMYLTYNGYYIEAVYHSTSNGITESSVNVWGNYYPYLINVNSPYDTSNSSFKMDKTISFDILSTLLNTEIDQNTQFNILSKTSGNRVEYIKINDKTYKGIELRNILGLRSADFDITVNDNEVIFTTRGYGHGVGLSQYGANGMAKNGYTYKEILSHYYPGTTLNS